MKTYCSTPPLCQVPDPTEQELKVVPGAWEAWNGMHRLSLRVCEVRGARVQPKEHRVAEFQSAPLAIAEALRSLNEAHTAKFADILSHMAHAPEGMVTVPPIDADPRTGQEEPEVTLTDLEEHDSEEALRALITISAEVKSQGDRQVTMLRSEQDIYLVARGADHTLAKHCILGSFGGGDMQPVHERSSTVGIPFDVASKGDKTVMVLKAAEEDGEGDGKDAKNKIEVGTLYSIVRGLQERTAGKEIKLTGHGRLLQTGSIGQHGYAVEHTANSQHHQAHVFVPRTGKAPGKATAGNIFLPMALACHKQEFKGIGLPTLRVPSSEQSIGYFPFRFCDVNISQEVSQKYKETQMATPTKLQV